MGRDVDALGQPVGGGISIHSPCMGRDIPNSPPVVAVTDFNPLSLHGERRSCSRPSGRWRRFQSTLPAWGETAAEPRAGKADKISIHSPCMGRDDLLSGCVGLLDISIHSPCMGRDHRVSHLRSGRLHFNPLSLHGERRYFLRLVAYFLHFNPLSLHGERRGKPARPGMDSDFNPLSLHGERRAPAGYRWPGLIISIHSPCMGRDVPTTAPACWRC